MACSYCLYVAMEAALFVGASYSVDVCRAVRAEGRGLRLRRETRARELLQEELAEGRMGG